MGSSERVNWVFDGASLIFFLVVLYLLLRKPPGSAAAAVAASLAVFCALMGNPNQFDTISFSLTGGIQTKARQVIEQAQVTIDQLQRLATALAEASLNELALSGQVFVGMPTAEKSRLRNGIVERLASIGVGQADLLHAQSLWINVNCSMLEEQIEAAVKAISPKTDAQAEIAQLVKGSERPGLPEPKVLKKWLASNALSDPKLDKLLQEYEYVWTNGSILHPDLIPFGATPRAPLLEELPGMPPAFGGPWNNGGVLSTDPPAPSR